MWFVGGMEGHMKHATVLYCGKCRISDRTFSLGGPKLKLMVEKLGKSKHLLDWIGLIYLDAC